MKPSEREVVEILERWAKALEEGDLDTVDELAADDLIHVDPSGAVHGKSAVLEGLRATRSAPLDAVETADVTIRVFGSVGVASGLTTMRFTHKGRKMALSFRFTDVMVREAEGWKIRTTHTTRVADS